MAALRVLRYASISMASAYRICSQSSACRCSEATSTFGPYLPERQTATAAEISYFGVTYVIPMVHDFAATVLAVSGRALIPSPLSLYLIVKHQLFGPSVLGTAIVAAVCHLLARPVPGLGIARPIWHPH